MATWQWARASRTREHGIGVRAGRRRATGLAAGALALALTVAGCSGDGQDGAGEGNATLMLAADGGNPTFEENFNPYLQNKRSATNYIYEPLIMVNPLDGEQVPWLAESWEQPDPATIEMTLREGVTWSDGEPLTTDDVAFTFELIREYPALDTRGAWTRIESVETTDTTVTFHLLGDDTPAVPVVGQTLIVPEHIWAEQDAPDTWSNTEPVGTGPFTLGNFTPQQYSMERNPDYWGEVAIDQIVLPSATEQLDIVNGDFDWGYSFMSDVENTWVGADENNTYWFPPGGVLGLLPNHDVEPFGDIDVRRGIALALDKDGIAEVASEGYMDAASQTGLLLPNHEELLNPDIPDSGIIAQDTDAAIAAFEDAGYTLDGGTLRTPGGEPFTFTITTPNGYTDWLRAVQEIQRQLAEIGIEVEINSPQAAAYEANLSNGDYEMAFGSGLGGGDPYASYNALLSSEFYAPNGESTQNNRIRYQSEEADELLVDYRSAVEETEQDRIIRELQTLMYDDLPGIAVYHGGMWGLFNTSRFTGWPSAEDPYASPQTWDSAPLQILTRLQPVQ